MRLIFSILLLVLLHTNRARGNYVSLAKPGCPDSCGNNVTIPYPFGISSECSANEFFRIECSNSTSPPKPFLKYVSLEALDFSLDRKVVRLMQGVFPLNCSTNTVILVGKTLTRDTPFRYSSLYNRLVVVGCGNEVRVVDSDATSPRMPSIGGCSPICGSATPSCNGINCGQTTVPSRYEEAEVFYTSTGNGRSGSLCGYTFLSDQRWLERDYIKYLNRSGNGTTLMSLDTSVPLILEWEFDISNATSSKPLESRAKCVNESVYYAASLDDKASNSINTTRCFCNIGFEGNPYLPGEGCVDVDECSSSSLNNCRLGHCINTVGSFRCKDPNGSSQSKSTVIGISSGSRALIFLGWGWILWKVIRKRIRTNRKKKFFKRNGGFLLKQKLSSNDGGVEKITLFTSKELLLATDRYNENRILGRGGQGTVYKGMLPDGKIVAVKKSKKMEQADIEAFINEVVILSQIRHRNVVRVLGCCLETEVPLLAYEFVPNGTLFEHIHDQNDEFPFTWKMRVRIAAEAAGALAYLHYAASAPIYHRDIKSTNMLLDEKYRAKVSDFDTSRLVDIDQTHVTARVMGTFGYLDPEYFQTNQFTEKSDVYSFGVVVVELLTGEKAVSEARGEIGRNLAAHFLQAMEENRLLEILDPKVLNGGREEIVAIAKIAQRCLHLKGRSRPTMKEVAAELKGIRATENGSILQLQHKQRGSDSNEIAEEVDFSSSEVRLLLGKS